MTVRVVTDSSCDLLPEVARELEITVVPLYLRFGEKTYRDGVDIGPDEFYEKLGRDPVHPSTSQPAPADFADAYGKLSKETDEIVSVHLSSKVSGTYESARQGRELMQADCCVEVIDSLSLSMGLGLIAMAAARLAKAGESLQRILDEVKRVIPAIRIFGLLDTLKYLSLGGRIGKSKALLGNLLNVKPLLTMRDGELVPAGLVRTRSKGLERLFAFARNALNLQELAIVHSTGFDEANSLKERVSSILAEERIHLSQLGPALGVHGGPGTLIIALRGKVSVLRQAAGEGEPLKKRFSLLSLHMPKLKFSCPEL